MPGGSTVKELHEKKFLQPLRVRPSVNATMRFETASGEPVQVDLGSFQGAWAAEAQGSPTTDELEREVGGISPPLPN